MRNIMVFFAVFVVLALQPVLAYPSSEKPGDDETAVRVTIQHYLHGLKFNDIDNLKQAFYPEARLFFIKKNGELGQLTQSEWYEGFKSTPGKEEEGDLKIASLDIVGNAASVKVEENYPASRYTDFLSLLKVGGQWRIVNKIFYAESKHP